MGERTAREALLDVLEHWTWYWLRLDGPDGLVWMLGRYSDRHGEVFYLPDDDRTVRLVEWVDKWGIYLHKWRIVQVHSVPHPGVSRDWIWCDDSGRLSALRGEVQDG